MLLFDPATRATHRSLAAAAELAAPNQHRLIVLAKAPADPAEIRRAIAEVSQSATAQCRIEILADLLSVKDRKLAVLDTGLLVVDATAGDVIALESLLARASGDVLLVR